MADRAELVEAGLNLMYTQLPDGSLTIGDTHHYSRTVDPYRPEHLDDLVFQKIHLVGRRTALDNVCSGALGRLPLHRSVFFGQDVREEAVRCLDRVGLADRALERCARLSGGQQQRVAIALALCQRANVILADESDRGNADGAGMTIVAPKRRWPSSTV